MLMQEINVLKSIAELDGTLIDIVRNVAGSAAEIDAVEEWGRGALNLCLKVTTRAQERFFLKIENDEILPVTRRGQIAREVAGNRLMQAVGVRCPAVLDHDCEGRRLGVRYLVEEFIDTPLLWELREELTDAEREQLKADIEEVVARMRAASSPLFGDLYPGGWTGQFATYQELFCRQWAMDLADCQRMALLTDEEAARVNAALEHAANAVVSQRPAGFYHGDLGIHNLLAEKTAGGTRLGWVIDFGNGLFLPDYMNEDGIRRFGGFGLEARDCASYDITPEEYAANDLLGALNWTAFAGMLVRTGRWDKDPRELANRLLSQIS